MSQDTNINHVICICAHTAAHRLHPRVRSIDQDRAYLRFEQHIVDAIDFGRLHDIIVNESRSRGNNADDRSQ